MKELMGFFVMTLVIFGLGGELANAAEESNQKEAIAKKGKSVNSSKADAGSAQAKSRADGKPEVPAANKKGSIEPSADQQRHRDPCTKQPELSECVTSMPKK